VDQNLFRETLLELNDRPCAFEKAIFSGLCRCNQAERFNLAEREGVHCHRAESQGRCLRMLELLRQQARFALKISNDHATLPHNKALRLQVGGLRGLRMVVEGEERVTALMIDDVDGLMQQASDRYGDLESLPFGALIKEIAAYKGRRRRSDRKD
jgi:hypothetical protein